MTRSELLELFETEMAHLIEKGMSVPSVWPLLNEDDEQMPGCDHDYPTPATHMLVTERPFIFDIRKIPDTFHGFTLYCYIDWDTKPEEFRGPPLPDDWKPKDGIVLIPLDILFAPEKVMAYAEEHVLEICEQLNDYTLTLKNICDMIVCCDFEQHKKECEEKRLKRLLN